MYSKHDEIIEETDENNIISLENVYSDLTLENDSN